MFLKRAGVRMHFIYIIGPKSTKAYLETDLNDPVPFLEHLSVSDREPHRVQIEKLPQQT